MEVQSIELLLKAMDGLALRQSVTAENIANASTPNYRPMRVTFEGALAEAARTGGGDISRLSPKIVPDDRADVTGAMRLDLELVDAASTAGRYGALINILSRQLELQGMAASWNR